MLYSGRGRDKRCHFMYGTSIIDRQEIAGPGDDQTRHEVFTVPSCLSMARGENKDGYLARPSDYSDVFTRILDHNCCVEERVG